MQSPFTKRIYELTGMIPPGKVASYGQLALLAGRPRASRIVGWAMCGGPAGLPYHRVIYQDGRLCSGDAFGAPQAQRLMLEEEGIGFLSDGRVDMEKYRWAGPED